MYIYFLHYVNRTATNTVLWNVNSLAMRRILCLSLSLALLTWWYGPPVVRPAGEVTGRLCFGSLSPAGFPPVFKIRRHMPMMRCCVAKRTANDMWQISNEKIYIYISRPDCECVCGCGCGSPWMMKVWRYGFVTPTLMRVSSRQSISVWVGRSCLRLTKTLQRPIGGWILSFISTSGI